MCIHKFKKDFRINRKYTYLFSNDRFLFCLQIRIIPRITNDFNEEVVTADVSHNKFYESHISEFPTIQLCMWDIIISRA